MVSSFNKLQGHLPIQQSEALRLSTSLPTTVGIHHIKTGRFALKLNFPVVSESTKHTGVATSQAWQIPWFFHLFIE
jgi:hypothetical protein